MTEQKPDRPPVFYGYARVSTDRQAAQGISLEGQDAEIREYYDRRLADKGVVWGGVYIDGGVSAYKKVFADRKAGKRIVERAEPGDHVCMVSIDRGFRSTVDALLTIYDWAHRGVHVHVTRCQIDTTTPLGKYFVTTMAAFAELERNMTSERTREAMRRNGTIEKIMQKKRQTGVFNGRPGYGYRLAGRKGRRRRVPDYDERRIIRLIVELKDQRGLTFEEIYWHLFRAGVRTRDDREWSCTRVAAAYYEAKGTWYKGQPASKNGGPPPGYSLDLSLPGEAGPAD